MASASTFQVFLQKQAAQQYPLDAQQLAAFETLFSDDSVPVSEIANQITTPYIKDGSTQPEDIFFLWRTIFDAVEQLTGFNDKLVELVTEIQKVPGMETGGHMVQFNQTWTEFRNSCKYSIQTF
jgi:hypothetical protein